MCGIAGWFELRDRLRPTEVQQILGAMTDALAHRGPDASGLWTDDDAGIALGHRRLSIVDTSEAGAQPMRSSSGRYVISLNGEIYNAPELGAELGGLGRRFRGHSDTEVLVEAIDEWGLDHALEYANGMFAFALWDRDDRTLHLVRDRLGEKPLYYGWFGDTLLFGSELKALRVHPRFNGDIDRVALTEFLRLGCVPAPLAIFKHVKKLPPASVLTVRARAGHSRESRPTTYWSVFDAHDPEIAIREISDEDATAQLEDALRNAVRLRLRSDVPLGAFLSGGIDSATVVALMQSQVGSPVRTFTIGSTSRDHDEADRAARTAKHLGTQHTQLVVTGEDALGLLPRLPTIYDEPFADSSQIPTLLVSQLARRDVTVSLSGDGGDEVFGGYGRYRQLPALSARLDRVPRPLRRAGARVVDSVPLRAAEFATAPLPRRYRAKATKLARLSALLSADSPVEMHRVLASHYLDPASIVIGGANLSAHGDEHWSQSDIATQAMARDSISYLPDDILVKVDRATMSVGLEGRIPFLDHHVVELMARMPARMKIRGGEGKWLLRRVLERHVPAAWFAGPKSGFSVPIGRWLRGPLRPWAEDLLSADRLRREGYFRVEPIRRMWSLHVDGRHDLGYLMWDVLMFQSWLETSAAIPVGQPADACSPTTASSVGASPEHP